VVPPSPDVFDSNQCAFLQVPRPEVASEIPWPQRQGDLAVPSARTSPNGW